MNNAHNFKGESSVCRSVALDQVFKANARSLPAGKIKKTRVNLFLSCVLQMKNATIN